MVKKTAEVEGMPDGRLGVANLMEDYEALRAFALGQGIEGPPPRGLAVFLRGGMPGWMGAWSRLEPSARWEAAPPPEGAWGRAGAAVVGDVVVVLAGMALAGGR